MKFLNFNLAPWVTKTYSDLICQNNQINLFQFLFYIEVLYQVLIEFLALNTQGFLWFDKKLSFQYDYYDFYNAAQLLNWGSNPYSIHRFNKPPLVLWLNTPLTYFPAAQAAILLFTLNLAAVIGTLILAEKTFLAEQKNYTPTLLPVLLGTLFFSYPVFLALDRGNLDGFVIFLCFFAFFLWIKRKREFLSGVCIGIATCLKIYPILFILPFIAFKKFRILLGISLTLFTLVLINPTLWWNFLNTSLLPRVSTDFDGWIENGSLSSLLHFFPTLTKENISNYDPFLIGLSYLLVAGGVAFCFYKDTKKRTSLSENDKAILTALYIPFCISVPQIAFFYEYLFIIPLAFVWTRLLLNQFQDKTWLVSLVGFALVLTQFPVSATLNLVPAAWRVCFIPGTGLLLLMIVSILVRILPANEDEIDHPSDKKRRPVS